MTHESDNLRTEYAKVSWQVGDIQAIRPDWTVAQCRNFFEDNERRIQDRLVELGWDVIETLLNDRDQQSMQSALDYLKTQREKGELYHDL